MKGGRMPRRMEQVACTKVLWQGGWTSWELEPVPHPAIQLVRRPIAEGSISQPLSDNTRVSAAETGKNIMLRGTPGLNQGSIPGLPPVRPVASAVLSLCLPVAVSGPQSYLCPS